MKPFRTHALALTIFEIISNCPDNAYAQADVAVCSLASDPSAWRQEQGYDPFNEDGTLPPPFSPPNAEQQAVQRLVFEPRGDMDWVSSYMTPCWVTEDACDGYFRLPIGHAVALYDKTDPSVSAVAYHSDGRCGYGDNAGDVPSDQTLIVYIPHAIAVDVTDLDCGTARFQIDVWEYANSNCTGPVISRDFDADQAACAVSDVNQGTAFLSAWSDTRRDCSGPFGDENNCHMPDIAISYPGSPGYYSYLYTIRSQACNPSETDCASYEALSSGCFLIEWIT